MVQYRCMPKDPADLSVAKKQPARTKRASTPRKAPTRLKQTASNQKQTGRQMVVGVVVVLLVSFGSIGIGVADEGQIDVSQVLKERNERIESGEESGETVRIKQVPVANQGEAPKPDGGLKGLGKGDKPTPPPDPAPTPAEETASSTDEESEADVDTESEIDTETEEAIGDAVGDGGEPSETDEPDQTVEAL